MFKTSVSLLSGHASYYYYCCCCYCILLNFLKEHTIYVYTDTTYVILITHT